MSKNTGSQFSLQGKGLSTRKLLNNNFLDDSQVELENALKRDQDERDQYIKMRKE